jgi:hypothetical protein
MNYKLLIVRNRYSKKLDFKKYLDWFALHTPLTITTEELTTDFDVTTQTVANGTYTGVICGADIIPKLQTVIPENKYHAVVFVYGNKLDGIRMNVANGSGRTGNLYKGTDLVQLYKVNDGGKTLNHELFHTFFARLARFGINLNDNMDTYANNSDLTVDSLINTNREVALQTLKPYWDKVVQFNLAPIQTNIPAPIMPSIAIIARKTTNPKETLGDMIAIKNGDTFLCKTLERGTDLRIPPGTYNVDWTFSPKFQKYTYELREMKSYRIHVGNYYSNSEGCILLGKTVADINKDGEQDITNSTETIGKFEDFFERKSFTLMVF